MNDRNSAIGGGIWLQGCVIWIGLMECSGRFTRLHHVWYKQLHVWGWRVQELQVYTTNSLNSMHKIIDGS